MKARRVFDPLYGALELSEDEFKLILSPEVQRLRYVRMCNINSLLVTGASEISRFEHILGVLRLTKEWIEGRGNALSEREKKDMCAAALLHDVQTGPFGHSLQYIFEDNEDSDEFIHDDIAHGGDHLFHQKVVEAASFMGRPFSSITLLNQRWTEVAGLIKGEGRYGPLINGSIDLDNIDNVVRLAYHVGVASHSDADISIRIARDINTSPKGLIVSNASLPLLKRWQEIRHRLYELLLLDWAEFSAKAMLTRAMEYAVEGSLLGADSWLLTDLEFYKYLEDESKGEEQEIGDLIKRVRVGDLYDPVNLLSSSSIDLYEKVTNIKSKREFEDRLSNELKQVFKRKVDLILHPILDCKKTDRAIEVTVRESNSKVIIGEDSKQLLLGVFVSFEIDSEQKKKSAQHLVEKFFRDNSFQNIRTIQDPMVQRSNHQMELL
jgi:HD superfamily phosphohydrolase